MDKKDGQKTEQNIFSRLRTPTPELASGGAFSLACVVPSVLVVILAVVLSVAGALTKGYENTDWWRYISYTVTPVAFALVVYAYLSYRKLSIRVAVRSQSCHWKYFLVAIALQAGLFALSELNGYFLDWLTRFGYQPTPMVLPSTNGFGIIGVLFAVAVLPAVFEELVFRGLLLDGLKKNFSTAGAVLICGALFALYHQRPEQTLYQFCCGTAYALLAIRAGSILPTALAHFLNNAIIVILYANGITAIPTDIFLIIAVVAGIFLVCALVYLIFMDKSQPKRNGTRKLKDFFLFASPGILIVVLGWLITLIAGF